MFDFHMHTVLSDGTLTVLETGQRVRKKGYKGLAITDHMGEGSLERILSEVARDCNILKERYGLVAIPGVELTHVPPQEIPALCKKARKAGAKLVIVHGETVVEPVEEGTNLAAVTSGLVDVLAHPGLITENEVKLAAKNGVYLEITTRPGHCLSNGHVFKYAKKHGAKLLLNSDAHSSKDLINPEFGRKILLGAGANEQEVLDILERNPSELCKRLGYSLEKKLINHNTQ